MRRDGEYAGVGITLLTLSTMVRLLWLGRCTSGCGWFFRWTFWRLRRHLYTGGIEVFILLNQILIVHNRPCEEGCESKTQDLSTSRSNSSSVTDEVSKV